VALDTSVKNLVFDLGGVILDLSVDKTLQAVAELSNLDKKEVTNRYIKGEGFLLYEKGLITEEEFRDFVRRTYAVKATDEAVDKAWNAMLLGLPIIKLELLQRLMNEYQVYLLSNTNTIHLRYINEVMLPPVAGVSSLDPYFHGTYYSHLMNKRKPDADIFLQVMEENNLKASETLFLDDNVQNVEGARAVGMQAIHVNTPDFVIDYFHA
jgi:putative hydrolase of the HAD superfamily